MAGIIELRGFMWLSNVFKERHWTNPRQFDLPGEISGRELLAKLDILPEQVACIFVNGKAFATVAANIKSGDRVALVSPGAPVLPWVLQINGAAKATKN